MSPTFILFLNWIKNIITVYRISSNIAPGGFIRGGLYFPKVSKREASLDGVLGNTVLCFFKR